MQSLENTLIYTKEFEVRWQDMDAFNHVNHAVYFIYMSETRFSWLRDYNTLHGLAEDQINIPVVAATSCKYLRPITYPAQISVELYFERMVGKKIYLNHIIRDKATPKLIYAEADVLIMWINSQTGRSIELPQEYTPLLTQK